MACIATVANAANPGRFGWSVLPGVAMSHGAPVLIWSTAHERGVVGFDLLRSGAEKMGPVLLNSALIAASNNPAGATYIVSLPTATAVGSDLTLRTWTEDGASTDQSFRLEERPEIVVPEDPSVAAAAMSRASARSVSKAGTPPVECVDIRTGDAGVYFVGHAELAGEFGLSTNDVAVRAGQGLLGLRQQGIPVPGWDDAASGGRYFFAPRIDTLFFAGNVTQARFEATDPMATVAAAPDPGAGRGHATSHLAVEKNLQAVPTLPGAAADDFWVWDPFLGGHPTFGDRIYNFDLPGFAAGNEPSAVEVEVASTSVALHQFGLALNGHVLGSLSWSGPERHTLRFDVDPAWLQPTTNALEITSTGDRTSLAYLDRFGVDYPRALRPGDGQMVFGATDDAVLESTGPAGSSVEVWDVTNPV
ncbi:MAG: hypothetical protein DVB31_16715, partial [Verrucomicrobia bacterium]